MQSFSVIGTKFNQSVGDWVFSTLRQLDIFEAKMPITKNDAIIDYRENTLLQDAVFKLEQAI